MIAMPANKRPVTLLLKSYGKTVAVKLKDGDEYTGRLVNVDTQTMNVWLADVETRGEKLPLVGCL